MKRAKIGLGLSAGSMAFGFALFFAAAAQTVVCFDPCSYPGWVDPIYAMGLFLGPGGAAGMVVSGILLGKRTKTAHAVGSALRDTPPSPTGRCTVATRVLSRCDVGAFEVRPSLRNGFARTSTTQQAKKAPAEAGACWKASSSEARSRRISLLRALTVTILPGRALGRSQAQVPRDRGSNP